MCDDNDVSCLSLPAHSGDFRATPSNLCSSARGVLLVAPQSASICPNRHWPAERQHSVSRNRAPNNGGWCPCCRSSCGSLEFVGLAQPPPPTRSAAELRLCYSDHSQHRTCSVLADPQAVAACRLPRQLERVAAPRA